MRNDVVWAYQPLIDKTRAYVEAIMKDDTSGHDFYHVMRVYHTATRLMRHTKADRLVVELAALLHDIDDPKLVAQTEKGVSRVELFLNAEKVHERVVRHVLDILRTMSYSAYLKGARVASIEGEIVQDADRLDAIGAIGIARAFAYGGRKGRPIYMGDDDDDSSLAHFHQKLLKLRALMNTREARAIAAARDRYLRRFLSRFYHEWEGKP